MAFRLEVLTGNPYVALASAVSIGATDDFDIEIKYRGPATSGGRGRPLGNSNSQSTNRFFIRESSPRMMFQSSTGSGINTPTLPTGYASDRAARTYGIFRFTRTSGTVVGRYNGTSFASATMSGAVDFDQFFRHGGSTGEVGEGVEYVSFVIAGVLAHYYDPSATNGTGTTLEDTAGTNDGALTNFSGVADSWWVPYGSGITITATLGTISYSSQDSIVSLTGSVDLTATLGTIAYSSNNTDVAVTGDIDVISNLGTISYASNNSIVAITGSVDLAATLGTISYSSNNTVVSVSGTVDVSATLGTITYASSNAVIELSGSVDLAATLGTINYSSNNVMVLLAGLIDVNATLGTISYTSNNTTVFVQDGQSLGVVTASFSADLYGASFKPNSITVNFKG